jgi:hypothetical protein
MESPILNKNYIVTGSRADGDGFFPSVAESRLGMRYPFPGDSQLLKEA